MSPGMHFNSLNCPIFPCSFCFDDSDALHICTLQAQRMCTGGGPVCACLCVFSTFQHQGIVFHSVGWAQGGRSCDDTRWRRGERRWEEFACQRYRRSRRWLMAQHMFVVTSMTCKFLPCGSCSELFWITYFSSL